MNTQTMPNYFDIVARNQEKLDLRALHFVTKAAKAIESLSIVNALDDSTGLCPDWVLHNSQCPTIKSTRYTNYEWQKQSQQIDLEITEWVDTWDDCRSAPEEWKITQIPEELFLNGTDEEIAVFFKARYAGRAVQHNRRLQEDKWRPLMDFTANELSLFMKVVAGTATPSDERPDFRKFAEIITTLTGDQNV